MLIGWGHPNITLNEVKYLFFDKPEVTSFTKEPQGANQPRVLVYINALIYEMQQYVLERLQNEAGSEFDQAW